MLSRKRDALALFVAMTFPSLMSWIEFRVLPGPGQDHGPVLGVVFALGKLAQFVFPVLYVHRFAPQEIQPPRLNRRGVLVGLGSGILIFAAILALYFVVLQPINFFVDTPQKVADLLARFHSNTPAVFFTMAIFVSLLHSMLEEYYWRWFVFGWLDRHLGLVAALGVSSLAFMAHHVIILDYYFPGRFWTVAVPFSLCVAAAGVIWGWLYRRYQSIYAPWVSHICADAALMVIGLDMLWKSW